MENISGQDLLLHFSQHGGKQSPRKHRIPHQHRIPHSIMFRRAFIASHLPHGPLFLGTSVVLATTITFSR